MAMNTRLKGLLPHIAFAMAKTKKSLTPPNPHTPSFSSLEQVNDALQGCPRCKLCKTRTSIVVGEGNPHPELLFVGEAPGVTEDSTGRPFVGKAGELLEKMIIAMGVKRSDVFLTNMLKCRPPENRKPDADEIDACLPFLKAQIDLLKPKVIVALGSTATSSLLGIDEPLSELRGRVHSWNTYKVIVTYHPAFLLSQPGAKKEAWEDLKLAMRELGWKS